MAIFTVTELKFLKFSALAVLSIFCVQQRILIESMITDLMNLITDRYRYVTKIKVHKLHYVWEIHDFSLFKVKLAKGARLESPIFTSPTEEGCKWRLVLYPNGLENSRERDSSLYLMIDDSSEYTNIFGEYGFSFINKWNYWNSKSMVDGSRGNEVEIRGNAAWGIPKFIQDHKEIPNNILKISVEGTFSAEINFTDISDESYSFNNSNIPERRLCSDLGRLFNNNEFTDFVLSVKGENFRVHKSILATRSPVFAAMFRHEGLEENQKNEVDIKDFDAEVIEAMLTYIYTGHSKKLKFLAEGLLKAADKYELDELKQMCEEVLSKNLSVENVIDLLIFSDLYRACNLKNNVISFITKNSAIVMKTTAWKEIASSHPQLLLEVCNVLACLFIEYQIY